MSICPSLAVIRLVPAWRARQRGTGRRRRQRGVEMPAQLVFIRVLWVGVVSIQKEETCGTYRTHTALNLREAFGVPQEPILYFYILLT